MERQKNVTREVPEALERFQKGDNAAFVSLMVQFHPLLSSMTGSFCRERVSSREWDEWYQEALIALHDAARTYDPGKSNATFGVYARFCVRNALVDKCRQSHREVSLTEEEERKLANVAVVSDPLETLVKREEGKLLYRRIVSILSPYEVRVFNGIVDGMTAREIAKLVGKPERSVSNAVYRLKKKLQAALRDH